MLYRGAVKSLARPN